LTPLLVLRGWAEIRQVSGVTAAFILVNSVAGLLGVVSAKTALPVALPVWAAAAMVGGYIGSAYGSRRLGGPAIKRLLAIVLAVAGFKMFITI